MDYSATIHVPATPQAALRAIHREIPIWWSVRAEMHPDGVTARFNNSHAKFEFDPNCTDETSRWPCVNAKMIIEGVADHEEWTGTALVWTVKPDGTGSQVTLTHEGLNANLECLDVCTRGWQHFFEGSLKDHLSGKPASPETN